MQYKNRKNLYNLIIITMLLGLIISLSGCNWFSLGLFNIIDPQAQIRLNYTEVNLVDGSITLEIYSLNEAEFIGTGFEYNYFVGGTPISSLYKMVGATFYVAPSNSPGMPGEITTIENLPLYFQEVLDYITLNPQITELTCTLNMIGTDGAGHDITKSVTVDLPAIQPGIDFEPPEAVINATPGTSGPAPFTVIFDAYSSTDDRGIASYEWDFGDGSTASGVMPDAHTYTDLGSYVVILTVTDYFGNVDTAFVTITVNESGTPSSVTLQAIPQTLTDANGTSQIIAIVKDAVGNPVTDGTTVTFLTTSGSLTSYSETTVSGIVDTQLQISSADATVTAQCGSVSNSITVTYSPPAP